MQASRSVATTTRAPASWAAEMIGAMSRTRPPEPGCDTSTPNVPSGRGPAGSASTTRIPNGSARVSITAWVCSWVSGSTTKTSPALPLARCSRAMASAAAVASSSIEALAISVPVRSVTIVWNVISASRRPCEISGWYGV